MAHRVAVALAASTLPFFPMHVAEAAEVAGSVVGVAGSCFAGAGSERAALKLSDPVRVGDTVQVAHDGKLKLRMGDGSIVSAGANSQFQIQSFALDGSGERREAKLALAAGLVHAIVSHTERPAIFEIGTAVGVAAARSTDWFVEAQGDLMQVAVRSGVVDLKSAKNPAEVSITPGNGSAVERSKLPAQPVQWPATKFDEWIAQTTIGIGWCQCVTVTTERRASCVPNQAACEATCGTKQYSVIPVAPQMCGDQDTQ